MVDVRCGGCLVWWMSGLKLNNVGFISLTSQTIGWTKREKLEDAVILPGRDFDLQF